jgi:hypothetical protein
VFAGEKVRPEYLFAVPSIEESRKTSTFSVLELDALVRMKLTSFRDKDRTHIRDLIGVGLVDASWPSRLPDELGSRLKQILESPEG